MSVKLLTDQIWKEAEKEKESLRKSLNGEIGRIDRIYQEKIKAVEKNLRIDLEKEKEKEISILEDVEGLGDIRSAYHSFKICLVCYMLVPCFGPICEK